MIESDQYLLSSELQDKPSSKKKLAAFITGLAVIAAVLASFGFYYFYYLNATSNDSGIHIPMTVHRPKSPDLSFDAQQKRVAKILCKDNTVDKACTESQNDIPVVGDEDNFLFIGTMEIGTPPQKFNVHFDTFIPAVWVADSGCPDSILQNHNTYDHTKSSTFEDLHEVFAAPDDVGFISGYLAKDTIKLGPFELDNFEIAAVNEVIVNEFEDIRKFSSRPYDGIFPLGFQTDVPLTLDVLKKTNQIKRRMFAFELREHGKQSFVTIGGYKESAFKGDIMWMSISNSRFPTWDFPCHVRFGDKTLAGNIDVKIDSATAGIALDRELIEKIAHQVHGVILRDTFYLPCAFGRFLPDFEFSHDAHTFKIPFSNVLRELDIVHFMCMASLIPVETKHWGGVILLGQPLFATYYTIFDADSRRIGLAEYK